MIKNKFHLFLAGIALAGVFTFGLMSFKKEVKNIPVSPLSHDGPLRVASFSSLSPDFASGNFVAYVVGDSAYFYQMNVSYIPSPTPPWYTNQYIGVVSSAYRPSGTRTFAGHWPGTPSQTVQFTLYSTGDLYMQQTGGAIMGRGAQIMSNKYKL